MKKRSALKMVLMSLATAILIPGTASSDVPADPWILSPVQEGQDVILTINFEEFLEIVTLIANNGSGERTVFEKKSFENEEPASTDPYCVYDE